MIDYKDLMLGNWVYLTEKSKYPMQVVGIGDNYCYLNFKGNEADPFDGVDKYIMPIKVTEELLLKIGFYRKELRNFKNEVFEVIYEHRVNHCYMEIRSDCSNSKDRDWYCHIYNKAFQSIGAFDFQYLHELQNGIRLITKGDLEIEEL